MQNEILSIIIIISDKQISLPIIVINNQKNFNHFIFQKIFQNLITIDVYLNKN